jgi:hypothetical protein
LLEHSTDACADLQPIPLAMSFGAEPAPNFRLGAISV